MEHEVTTLPGSASVKSVELSDTTFGSGFNAALVHQVVTAYMAAGRAGTKANKNRSAVRGGGAKPWRQKGSGRARAGTIRSPLWRGGGVTFAAQPRSYSQKVNRKMYRRALCSILSELIRQERLILVESFTVDSRKTRELVEKLHGMSVSSALIVSDSIDDNLHLSARNLRSVDVCRDRQINPVSLIGFEKVICTVGAIKAIEVMLA